jgi:replicative DNA helicase
MQPKNKLLASALWYQRHGWHPVPCKPRDKKPWVKWEAFQATQPNELLLASWWEQQSESNVALVTGRGCLVVDLDGNGAEELLRTAGVELPVDAPRVKTGRGEHVYLGVESEYRNVTALVSAEGGKPAVDIRCDGGFVVAPPSIHETGAVYAWIIKPFFPLPPAPQSLLALLEKHSGPKLEAPQATREPGDEAPQNWVAEALAGVTEGKRDDTAARLAGYFVQRGLPAAVVHGILLGFAERCRPPFPVHDIDRIVASIAQTDARKHPAGDPPRLTSIGDALRQVFDSIKAGPARCVKTPFPQLNSLLVGGFHPGEFIVLGARPGVGKSAISLEMAREAALSGLTTLIVSREMLSLALARRMLAQAGKVRASYLRSGVGVDMEYAGAVASRLSGLPIWIADTAASMLDVNSVLASVPQPVDFLVIDYLQLLQAPREIRDRRHQVEFISSGLKQMALERQIPVLCLSSLSRPAEGKESRPTMAMLRESGEIEHDSDVVLLLHRERGASEADLLVAKGRDCETGVVKLMFMQDWVSFAEMEQEEPTGPMWWKEGEATA